MPRGIKNHYDPVVVEYVREAYKQYDRFQLVGKVNEKFNLNIDAVYIGSLLHRFKIKTPRDTRFKLGNEPATKGKKQTDYMSPEAIERTKATRFKPKTEPFNKRKVGDARFADNIIVVKYKSKDTRNSARCWKSLRELVWEYYHPNEKLKDNEYIIFASTNDCDFRKTNLLKTNKQELMRMNNKHLITECSDITHTNLLITRLEVAIKDKSRNETK